MTPPGPRTRRGSTLLVVVAALLLAFALAGPTADRAGAGPGTTVGGTASAPPGTTPAPTGPTTTVPTATPDPATAPEPARGLRLLGQTPFVAPTDTLVLTLGTDTLPADTLLTFELYGSITARAGRNGIDETLQGQNVSGVLARIRNIPLAFLPPHAGGGVDTSFTIVPSGTEPEFGFRISDPGVYPLSVIATGPDGGGPLGELRTYVIRVPAPTSEARPPLEVATLVPVAAPPALQTDGSTKLEPTEADRLTDLVDVLAAEREPSLTVAPVPETVDALATARPATVDTLRRSLTGRQVVSGPYVDLDTPAWVDAGLDDEFRHQLTTGADALTARLGATPLPDRRTWLAAPTTTPATFGALATFGIDRTVLPESMLVPLDARDLPGTLAQPFEVQDDQGGRLRAVMADLRLATRLGVSDDPALAAQVLLADLATIWFEDPTVARGVVVAVPAEDPHAIAALAPFLAGLTWTPADPAIGTGLLTDATVDALFELAPATGPARNGQSAQPLVRPYVPQAPAAGHESLGTYPARLDAAQVSVDGYRSMVAETAADRVPPLQRLLDVSGASDFDSSRRQAYLDASTAQVASQVAAITLPPDPEGITLAATEAEIPLVVDNALDYPVKVRIDFASEKLEFTAGTSTEVVLVPGSNRLAVPVKTRASGLFPVDVRMTSPDGNIAIASNRFEIRSTAISGLGLVLSIGAGIFLLIWWARHWRDGRRARKLVDGEGRGDGPGDDRDEAGAVATTTG